MDSNDNNSSQPTHLKLDAETHRLWEIFLKARRDNKNLFLMGSYLECLCGRFDHYESELVLPVSAELRILIQRAKDLTDDWYEHDAIIDQSLQDVAWQFATHAYGLHRGDLVRREERIISTDHFFAVDETVGNLGLRGRILTKSGKPGKRELEFSLLHKAWSS
jgi:hypothetical protein